MFFPCPPKPSPRLSYPSIKITRWRGPWVHGSWGMRLFSGRANRRVHSKKKAIREQWESEKVRVCLTYHGLLSPYAPISPWTLGKYCPSRCQPKISHVLLGIPRTYMHPRDLPREHLPSMDYLEFLNLPYNFFIFQSLLAYNLRVDLLEVTGKQLVSSKFWPPLRSSLQESSGTS